MEVKAIYEFVDALLILVRQLVEHVLLEIECLIHEQYVYF